MFLLLFGLFMGYLLVTLSNQGPKVCLWRGWLLAMLMLPVWMAKGFGSVSLDFRTGAAIVGIGGFLIDDREKLRYKFAMMDVLVLSLFLTHLISGFGRGEMSLMTVPEIARRWLMPYIVGRVFIASSKDFAKFLPAVAPILLALSVYAAVEAFTKINPMCKLLGKSYPILEAGEGYRWGIKRAQGPLDHPIFYGLTLVMSYPMAVELGRRALMKQGPKWWMALPFCVFLAVFCTASRGPIIAAIATVYLTVTFSMPKLRVVLLLVMMVGGFTAVQVKDHLKDAIASMAEDDEFVRYVEIDGKEYRYTGTAHRELLFKVYRVAMRDCPLFGYGARLRSVPIAEHLKQRFSSIDNHYLLFYLQRGKAGLTLFLSITLLALCYLIRMAWNHQLSYSAMSGSMVGALLGVSSLLTSVWFAPDHGAVWLFLVGLATCMHTLPADEDDQTAQDREDSDRDTGSASPIETSSCSEGDSQVVSRGTSRKDLSKRRRHPGTAPLRW